MCADEFRGRHRLSARELQPLYAEKAAPAGHFDPALGKRDHRTR
jgi:hypothetical protein